MVRTSVGFFKISPLHTKLIFILKYGVFIQLEDGATALTITITICCQPTSIFCNQIAPIDDCSARHTKKVYFGTTRSPFTRESDMSLCPIKGPPVAPSQCCTLLYDLRNKSQQRQFDCRRLRCAIRPFLSPPLRQETRVRRKERGGKSLQGVKRYYKIKFCFW